MSEEADLLRREIGMLEERIRLHQHSIEVANDGIEERKEKLTELEGKTKEDDSTYQLIVDAQRFIHNANEREYRISSGLEDWNLEARLVDWMHRYNTTPRVVDVVTPPADKFYVKAEDIHQVRGWFESPAAALSAWGEGELIAYTLILMRVRNNVIEEVAKWVVSDWENGWGHWTPLAGYEREMFHAGRFEAE